MKKIGFFALAFILVLGAWYWSWSSAAALHVARVKATIAYYNQQYKTNFYRATIKNASVHSAGFPFATRIVLNDFEVTMVRGNETFAVSIPRVTLSMSNEKRGEYDVTISSASSALYSINGSAPEQYSIVADDVPSLALSICNSKDCEAKQEDVLQFISGFLPKHLLLNATLNGKTQAIAFDFPLPTPFSFPIPADISYPLSIYVGMYREALVLRK